MSNSLSSLLFHEDKVSPEMRRKIEYADSVEISILCLALRDFYNLDEKTLEKLLPQAAQLEQLIKDRLDLISPHC